MATEDPQGFLPKGGNYRELLSYRKTEIVYDLTFRFCEKFLQRSDRTIDQRVQAARSGKQNIARQQAALKSTDLSRPPHNRISTSESQPYS